MSATFTAGRRTYRQGMLLAAACCAGILAAGSVRAQATDTTPASVPKVLSLPTQQPPPPTSVAKAAAESGIEQASCRSCGTGHGGYLHGGMVGCGSGGCGSHCYPGRFCDHEPGRHQDNFIARLWDGCYECLCCPDPCYEPRWVAVANSAFWADQVRPKTQMRFRWDAWRNGQFRDRAEYLNARADGRGKGPRTPAVVRYDNDEFYYYMEGATERFGLFVEMAYRNIDPEFTPSKAGFIDMNIGTKSLLLDCELTQIAFQFRTFIPTGQPAKGLGTGHTSLEPSLLMALKLGPSTYMQAQAAYWIPISGDQEYAGDVFHYHLSLNHVLWRPLHGVQVIGTAEFNGWSFLDGAYTLPVVNAAGVRSTTQVDARGVLLSAGPGMRVVICDKIDFGLGTAFAITSDKMAEQMYRAEFRWRF